MFPLTKKERKKESKGDKAGKRILVVSYHFSLGNPTTFFFVVVVAAAAVVV